MTEAVLLDNPDGYTQEVLFVGSREMCDSLLDLWKTLPHKPLEYPFDNLRLTETELYQYKLDGFTLSTSLCLKDAK